MTEVLVKLAGIESDDSVEVVHDFGPRTELGTSWAVFFPHTHNHQPAGEGQVRDKLTNFPSEILSKASKQITMMLMLRRMNSMTSIPLPPSWA